MRKTACFKSHYSKLTTQIKGESIVGTGPLIAVNVMLLYIILGPVLLFAIYVLFDSLDPTGRMKKDSASEKDPALWTSDDIDANGFEGMCLDRRRNQI